MSVQPADLNDPALVTEVDLARAAAQEEAGDEPVGAYVSHQVEDESAVTHLFEADKPSYRGWRWAVTVTSAGPDTDITVSEVVLLPGPSALVAPEWIPWQDRVQAGDLGVGDLLPTDPDDPRLVPAYLESDDPAVEEVAMEVGLGRARVMTRPARLDAATRWQQSEFGPRSDMARSAPAHCGTCGFYLPLAGALRAAFGTCGNEISPADGHVVHTEYGCGAHSEADVEQVSPVLVADLIYDDAQLDVEPLTVVDEVPAPEATSLAEPADTAAEPSSTPAAEQATAPTEATPPAAEEPSTEAIATPAPAPEDQPSAPAATPDEPPTPEPEAATSAEASTSVEASASADAPTSADAFVDPASPAPVSTSPDEPALETEASTSADALADPASPVAVPVPAEEQVTPVATDSAVSAPADEHPAAEAVAPALAAHDATDPGFPPAVLDPAANTVAVQDTADSAASLQAAPDATDPAFPPAVLDPATEPTAPETDAPTSADPASPAAISTPADEQAPPSADANAEAPTGPDAVHPPASAPAAPDTTDPASPADDEAAPGANASPNATPEPADLASAEPSTPDATELPASSTPADEQAAPEPEAPASGLATPAAPETAEPASSPADMSVPEPTDQPPAEAGPASAGESAAAEPSAPESIQDPSPASGAEQVKPADDSAEAPAAAQPAASEGSKPGQATFEAVNPATIDAPLGAVGSGVPQLEPGADDEPDLDDPGAPAGPVAGLTGSEDAPPAVIEPVVSREAHPRDDGTGA